MPLLINLLRNPWAIGALSVILVGGIQQGFIWRLNADNALVKAELAHQRQAWAEASAAGEKAARAALEAAVADERADAARRMADETAALERLRESADKAAREAGEWRRRYREAVEQDASCRAWSETPVACPL